MYKHKNARIVSTFFSCNSHTFGKISRIRSPPFYARRAAIAQSVLWTHYGMKQQEIVLWSIGLAGVRGLSFLHSVQAGPVAHQASYSLTLKAPYPGIKELVLKLPLTSFLRKIYEWVEINLHSTTRFSYLHRNKLNVYLCKYIFVLNFSEKTQNARSHYIHWTWIITKHSSTVSLYFPIINKKKSES